MNKKADPKPADLNLTPSNELSSIAGKILARDSIEKAGDLISSEKFNSLLADAKKLAGFVLNADPAAGDNADA